MKAQGSGDIVNVSSVAAITAPPTGAAYSATKAAVRTFSESLRKETGRHGTRVTCIYPGLVETELFDGIPSAAARDALKTRMAQVTPLQAIDLANAILFVVSQPRHAAIHELVMRPSTQDF